MRTLLLDRTAWDLVLDSSGNIALATEPYACAQDVASAIRLFAGEMYYDTAKGVPYWMEILGHRPSLSLAAAHIVKAAEAVPGVRSAVCTFTEFTDRALKGRVVITLDDGTTQVVSF
ncbi:hypothetical protein [Bordetella sp. 02P26C-1]|uniref:hypothetical protein n=1 Tax=Bordetella sp. 02P26C-1 TaxID=2683195 RepID=UPI0013548170|nr:hypothetical protein [Bordetella sp. 02P26C-1]MVW80169.1 hypothetical protein [Bordetella sp. 02P26C-1]